MEEWREYKLEEVCKVINGRAYKHEELLDVGKYKVLRVGNIFQGNNWYYSDLELPEDKYCKKGDLLYAWSCGFAPYIWEGEKTIYHYHIWKLVENKKYVDRLFLYYYLIENTKFFLGGTHGSVMLHLTKGDFEQQLINLPQINIQRKIASILKSLDDKIEVNRRINENLEQQAHALFKSWFVDFEPFKNGEFVESELGMIPKGWRVGKLGDFVQTTSGGTPSRKVDNYYSNGTINWVKSKELPNDYIFDTEEMITENAIKNSSAKLLPKHTVLIAMYGATVGKFGIIEKQMACNQAICALLPNSQVPFSILYMFAYQNKDNFLNKAIGSAQQNISQIIIKNSDFVFNSEAFNNYHRIVEPFFNKIEAISIESRRLAQLRDTLLPRLMSGELKVNEIENVL